MTKPLARWTIEGADMTVLVRLTKRGGFRIKATDHAGDPLREMRIAAAVGEVLRAAYRHESGEPDLQFIVGPMRHIDDHEPRP